MFPQIDLEKCIHCQLCITDCVANAIIKDTKVIIEKKCIRCGHCAAICPVEAVTINGVCGEELTSLPEKAPFYLESLIKGRRSVRHYKEENVPRETIEKILNTANCAPTGTNSRMSGVTVLDTREKINDLTDIIMKHFEKMTGILLNSFTRPLLILILGSVKTRKLFTYKKLISKYSHENNILTHDAPLLLIFHADKNSSSPGQDGIILATTAMYYAESIGVGTCFNGLLVIGINTCSKAKRFLNIQKGHKVYESFTAGYNKLSYRRGVIRDDLNVNYV